MITCVNCYGKSFSDTGYSIDESKIIKCDSCSLVRLSLFSSEYDDSLYSYYESYASYIKSDEWKERSRLNASNLILFLKDISKNYVINDLNKKVKLLDFGCGLGSTLAAGDKLGWDVFGIEMSKFCLDYCNESGFNVSSDLSDIPLNKKFDIITLFDVIEHVPNPIDTFNSLKSRLSPNGILLVTCPNWNSLERYLFGSKWKAIDPQHYHYFTSQIMKEILIKSNFSILKLITKNFNPFQYRKSNISNEKNLVISKTSLKNKRGKSLILLRTFASFGIGLFIKKILNLLLKIFSLGSTMVIVCK